MLNYVLIGFGGAIGSMLRAWLGTAVVGLVGPGFPWGTILINVAGSFAIGGFATLTATDGRFAVPFDARSFVMVGLCGGFTTFSSFSLQTLELARDGRAGQALGNVALSVLLCLAGVAAGSRLALAVRASPLAIIGETADARPGGSTVVALYRPDAVPSMLAAADRLMADGGGRTLVLAIDRPLQAGLQPTEEVSTRKRRQAVADHRRHWVEAMRPTLDRWMATERGRGRRARWIAVTGDGLPALAEHGRGARLLLLEHRPGDVDARPRIRAALLRAGRPVLLVPPSAAAGFGRVVAVAWRDDPHVLQAIRAATPLLSRAERVVVLHVGDGATDAGVPDILADARCEVVAAPAPADGDVGGQLVAMAHEAGADLLVMGGHDGGVTETVLRSADLAVLLGRRAA